MLFNSQAFVYWKTPRMHELDETIGDIYGRICDQEFNMANQLREKVPLLHKKGDQQRSGILMSNYFEKIITANFQIIQFYSGISLRFTDLCSEQKTKGP